jgi:hypothetical protein
MNDQERNYYNTFVRIRDFGAANHDAIKNVAAAVSNFSLVSTGVEEIDASGELQTSGAVGNGVVRKDLALAELRARLRQVNRTARALAVDNPSIVELFRMTYNNNEQQMLATARAFLTNATPIAQLFIDYGMPAEFIDQLEAAIGNYEQAITQKNAALDKGLGATADIGATIRETLSAVRRLRGIVPNIFAANPQKLAEWKSASHVRVSSRTKTTTASGNNAPNL